jgi:hypothetical protein
MGEAGVNEHVTAEADVGDDGPGPLEMAVDVLGQWLEDGPRPAITERILGMHLFRHPGMNPSELARQAADELGVISSVSEGEIVWELPPAVAGASIPPLA